jgi:hypothetical protein
MMIESGYPISVLLALRNPKVLLRDLCCAVAGIVIVIGRCGTG